ncbi:MAG: 2-oxoacid:acceptor oxidoreductase family protein, partial [Rhodocyclaceae bacterium]|nr:2-oxoacid:acceptor oxidoreductase family protein [Rhodocyclaceae bacterium]
IDEAHAAEIGLRLFKVGMPWPLEADSVRSFAEGLEEILVVEEKRQIIEYQLKEMLYNWREDVRPRVVGKFDESGEWPVPHSQWLLPPTSELTPALVARAIAARIGRFHTSEKIRERLAFLEAKEKAMAKPRLALLRTPYFCPGCPHNQSTKVPEGSCALGGVGCHLMAVWMGRNTVTISQMGGEGATWLGTAPHSGTQHIFANMGDGTYYHSGIVAIRAAIASGVNITYKLLYNDAVAMTGGQPVDGPLTVPQVTRQLAAEGVARIIVMSDEPEKYQGVHDFAPGIDIRHREQLEATQRELREIPGVTALIYDQTCAAEKRRRRKRGTYPDPDLRVFINELVCEGCGDCSVKSNCLAVVPVETEFGRKRAIDQFSCNKDYSCLDGFCPSLVTVRGGKVRRGRTAATPADAFAGLPEPALPALARPYGILVAGVGGTGVVTIGALVGMAAHLEGKGATVLDMTGLAQKGGAVMSHIRIAQRQDDLYSARITTGEANL